MPAPAATAPPPEIYGEGLRLPGVRLYTQGRLNRDIDSIIFSNVRTPEERRGDLSAQLAANLRGAVRVQEIAQKYGVDVVLGMMTGVQDYSERMIRAQLERLDDGEYSFEDFCDGDGILSFGQTEDEPIWVRLRVKKHGDSMTIDFAGSDDQVEGPMNAPLAVTASGVYTAVKMIIDPNDIIPANLRHLARHRRSGPRRQRGERAAPRPRRLRQPRDDPPHRRHGVRRSGPRLPRARPSLLPRHLRHPDPRRPRPPHRPALRQLRDPRRWNGRPPQPGRHQRREGRHQQTP